MQHTREADSGVTFAGVTWPQLPLWLTDDNQHMDGAEIMQVIPSQDSLLRHLSLVLSRDKDADTHWPVLTSVVCRCQNSQVTPGLSLTLGQLRQAHPTIPVME